jgi:CRP/FNR family transcriptional regulator
MTFISSDLGGRLKQKCSHCALRYRGLCRGIGDQDDDGVAALESSHAPIRVYDAGDVIYAQGDAGEHVFNLISGWVALHRDLADGRRQIVQFLLAGALFGVEPANRDLSHGATAITNASACPIARPKLDDLRRDHPSLNERFIWLLQQDSHRLFEMQAMIGQGSAKERICGLLKELALAAAGEASISNGATLRVPLTQRHIGEATGLTSIHVNRVLRQLREDRVVEFHDGVLTVVNLAKLSALTDDPGAETKSPAGSPTDTLPMVVPFAGTAPGPPAPIAKAV